MCHTNAQGLGVLSLQTIKPLVRDTEHNSRQVRTTHSDTSHTDRLGLSLSVTGYEAIIDHINRGRPLDVVVAYMWPLLFTHLSNGTLQDT